VAGVEFAGRLRGKGFVDRTADEGNDLNVGPAEAFGEGPRSGATDHEGDAQGFQPAGAVKRKLFIEGELSAGDFAPLVEFNGREEADRIERGRYAAGGHRQSDLHFGTPERGS
jgi:hypothetical protein